VVPWTGPVTVCEELTAYALPAEARAILLPYENGRSDCEEHHHHHHTTVVDARADHIDLWWTAEQYNRPKWGIYRSIRSSGLQETYLLLRNL
jgi:hypothetical protein